MSDKVLKMSDLSAAIAGSNIAGSNTPGSNTHRTASDQPLSRPIDQAPRTPPPPVADNDPSRVPLDEQKKFVELQNANQHATAAALARSLTQRYPAAPFAWKALGSSLSQAQALVEAEQALDHALTLSSKDPEIYYNLGCVYLQQGRTDSAIAAMNRAIELKADFEAALVWLGRHYRAKAQYDRVEALYEKALKKRPNTAPWMKTKAANLMRQGKFAAGTAEMEKLAEIAPNDPEVLNGLGNGYYNLCRFTEGEEALRRSCELAPNNFHFFSDRMLLMHYNPALSPQQIRDVHLEWDQRFRPRDVIRAEALDRNPKRRLRIGMISAGFRMHPVGQMITSALLFLPKQDVELFAYTMSDKFDAYTDTIQRRVDHWSSVFQLSDAELDHKIRTDGIDIVLDLCGHTEGNRSRTMAMEPAPLLVKWVGGQINTTGLQAMDYMLSDSVETPPGVDDHYVEKLIRLPDDYICYVPRGDSPEVGPVPALKNGHITFGCFNNPAKINPVLIKQWAKLMHQVPNCRLFLKGSQYDSKDLVERITLCFAEHGIAAKRLTFEQRSPQLELLDCYNRVDIALDPWPYSGGLTTCEALLMGVPVVTLPGPTFAGRHSASHLTHAGLAQMVAEDWDDYLEIATGLANDLDQLTQLRTTLRRQLQRSPVCNAHRFAHHLNTALRAIWTRYCEGKSPSALTFRQDGSARFVDDEDDIAVTVSQLQDPRTEAAQAEVAGDPPSAFTSPTSPNRSAGGTLGTEASTRDFNWSLPRQIIVLDSGASLLRSNHLAPLRDSGGVAIIGFDPASRVASIAANTDNPNVQLIRHAVLGDGQPASLHACLDPALSSVLPPLDASELPPDFAERARVLTTLPISTVALDDIDGLNQIDWLLLDEHCDTLAVLNRGGTALEQTLLLQIRLHFQPRYQHQATIGDVLAWASGHGFQLYRINAPRYGLASTGVTNSDAVVDATQLESADLILVPDSQRQQSLSTNQRTILAFLLDSVFNIRDLSHHLLCQIDSALGEAYLAALADLSPEKTPAAKAEKRRDNVTMALPQAPHMSVAERALFKKALAAANSYFEFGCGGSTVWAVAAGLDVYGVESDHRWVSALRDELGEKCKVEAIDIGPTGQWGMPVNGDASSRFANYSCAIERYQRPFDLILVDGRFRVACVMKSITHILQHHPNPAEARLFIHDFWNRPHYHAVLAFIDGTARAESAGLFRLKPDLDQADIEKVWRDYCNVPH